jgi:hypothetical protein
VFPPHPSRLPVALAAAAATALLGAAPALASEGPAVTPAPLPGLAPAGIPALVPAMAARPVLSHTRLEPRRVRRGKRAVLRLSVSAPGKLTIVISRMTRPGRGRVTKLSVPVSGLSASVRLPKRAHGKLLAVGRYRVSVQAADAQGRLSRTVRRSLRVIRAG